MHSWRQVFSSSPLGIPSSGQPCPCPRSCGVHVKKTSCIHKVSPFSNPRLFFTSWSSWGYCPLFLSFCPLLFSFSSGFHINMLLFEFFVVIQSNPSPRTVNVIAFPNLIIQDISRLSNYRQNLSFLNPIPFTVELYTYIWMISFFLYFSTLLYYCIAPWPFVSLCSIQYRV